MRGRVASISSRSSSPGRSCVLRTRERPRPARPELPARTGRESLASASDALLDPLTSLVPPQTGQTLGGGLAASLYLRDPGLTVTGLNVGIQACQQLRSHAGALAF